MRFLRFLGFLVLLPFYVLIDLERVDRRRTRRECEPRQYRPGFAGVIVAGWLG